MSRSSHNRFKNLFSYVIPIGLLVIVAACCILFLMYKKNGLQQYWFLQKQLPEGTIQLAALQNKVNKVKEEIEHWKTDHYYLEKAAREDLHLARSDEKVFIMPSHNA